MGAREVGTEVKGVRDVGAEVKGGRDEGVEVECNMSGPGGVELTRLGMLMVITGGLYTESPSAFEPETDGVFRV